MVARPQPVPTAFQQQVIDLCSRPEGATSAQLAEATGKGHAKYAWRVQISHLAARYGYQTEFTKHGRVVTYRMQKPSAVAA